MSPPFRVGYLGPARERLVRWNRWAHQHGMGDLFLKSARTIAYRLLHEASDWGEEYHYFASTKLQMRFGSEGCLGVNFGVKIDEPVVIVQQFQFMVRPSENRPPDS